MISVGHVCFWDQDAAVSYLLKNLSISERIRPNDQVLDPV